MSKSILIAIGFFFSFILGSLFTATYLEHATYVRQEKQIIIEKTKSHGEISSFKVVPSTEVIISTSKLALYLHKGKLLEEVIVRPLKITDYKSIKKDFNTVNLSLPKTIIIPYVGIEKLETIEPITSTSFLNRPEAKARAPGTSLVPTSNNNFKNLIIMLRSEKKALKNILKLLYANKNYFKIKNNGTIVIKRNWYSAKRINITWDTLFNVIIPNTMVGLSVDLAEEYFQKIVEKQNENSNDFQLIKLVESQFSNFCLETGFLGKTSIESYEHPRWKKSITQYNFIIKDSIESIKQYNISSLLSRYFPEIENKEKLATIQSLPSRSIKSLKDILDLQLKQHQVRRIGMCMSGIPNIDKSWPKVFRLVEKKDFI